MVPTIVACECEYTKSLLYLSLSGWLIQIKSKSFGAVFFVQTTPVIAMSINIQIHNVQNSIMSIITDSNYIIAKAIIAKANCLYTCSMGVYNLPPSLKSLRKLCVSMVASCRWESRARTTLLSESVKCWLNERSNSRQTLTIFMSLPCSILSSRNSMNAPESNSVERNWKVEALTVRYSIR